jgi:hypothetical protein
MKGMEKMKGAEWETDIEALKSVKIEGLTDLQLIKVLIITKMMFREDVFYSMLRIMHRVGTHRHVTLLSKLCTSTTESFHYYAIDDIKMAMRVDWRLFRKLGYVLRSRSYLLKYVMEINPLVLQYAIFEHRHNTVIVVNAVSKNGMALKYASDHAKNSIDVVLVAARQNIKCLRYVNVWMKKEVLKIIHDQ